MEFSKNIPAFLGYSDSPHVIMTEYTGFNFAAIKVNKIVCNLEDFYHYVDDEFDFE